MNHNETVARRIFTSVLNEARIDDFDDVAAEDVVVHYGTTEVRGRDSYKAAWQESHDAFPDESFTIDDMTSSGDQVITRWSWTATNRGGYLGSAPDGKTVRCTGISIYRFENGVVTEAWVEMNELDLARQLGVLVAS